MTLNTLFRAAFLALATIIATVVATAAASAEARAERPLVLVIASYHMGQAWTASELQGLRDGLGAAADVAVEFMDMKRLPDGGHLPEFEAMLAAKHRGRPPDVVAALDDDAFGFIMAQRAGPLAGAPVVFTGVNHYDRAALPPDPVWHTGVVEQIDIAATVAAIRGLQPDLARLAVVNNTRQTASGAAVMRAFQEQTAGGALDGLDVVVWEDLPAPDLTRRLGGLGPRDAVLLLLYNRDPDGRVFDHPESARLVASASAAPVYGMWEMYLGQGVVGGRMTDGRPLGLAAAAMILDALDGRGRGDPIPVRPAGPTSHAFDHAALLRWGLDPDRVPPGSRMVNSPPPLLPPYDRFPTLYWMAGAAALLAAAAVGALGLWLASNMRERSAAEALAAQSSEELRAFRDTLDETRDCVFVVDASTGRFIYANKGAIKQVGYSRAELMEMGPYDIVPDSTPESFARFVAPVRNGERADLRFETVHRHKNGGLVPVEVQLQYVEPGAALAGRYIAVVRDVTERRAAEAALRASEQRLELALTASMDGVWDWDLATGRIWFSPRWKEQLGYRDDELENTLEMWSRLIHPEDMADAMQRVADYNAGRTPVFDVVQRFRHKDGHTVYIHSRAIHLRNDAGEVVRMVGAHSDITERVRTERRLRESEQRFRDLAATVPGMVYQWVERRDGSHGFTWVSPRVRDLFGIDGEELLADWTRFRIHPDDLEQWRDSIETAVRLGIDWEYEGRRIDDKGATRWWKGLAKAVPTDEGVRFNGIFLDVTEERLLRDETDRLRTRLDFLLNANPTLIYAFIPDEDSTGTFVSAAIAQYGYTPEEMMEGKHWWLERVHPEDRESAQAAQPILYERGEVEHSYRFRTADGQWRWIIDKLFIVPDRNGKVKEVVGAMTDITRVVEAERRAREAQERLELVLRSAGEGIYGLDEGGRTIFANAAVERLTGYSAEELSAGGSHALLHHSHEDGTAYPLDDCPVIRTLADGRTRAVADEVFWRKSGAQFPVEYVVTPIPGSGGGPQGAVVVFRDVSEKRRSEEALRQSMARLEAVLTNSPVGISIVTPDRRFLSVNDRLAEIFGAAPTDLDGRSSRLIYRSDEDYVALGRRAYPVIQAGGIFHDEMEMRRFDGTSVWTTLTGSLIDRERPDQGVVWIVEDISGRKAVELALRTKTAELERSNAELEAFAYVASHDLRQPLRVVNSYLTLLERRIGGELDAESREFIGFARDGATRMDRLIVDLLEYSRVGRRSKGLRPLALAGVVERAVRNLSVAIAEAHALVEIDPDLPAVEGDDGELVRLFQNLVGNAVKYCRPDRPPSVRIRWARRGGDWEIRVEDNGIGVPAEHRDRVFGIFQRLHTRGEYEGTGIGLAVCRKIVEHHGGRIWVEAQPDGGSAFVLTLPAKEAIPA